MRNTVSSSKHTEELRNGRKAVGQKSKSKVYGKMQGSAKRTVSSREPGNEAALVYRNGWEPGWEEVRGWDVEQRAWAKSDLSEEEEVGSG